MIENLPINEYHARPEISSSILKAVMISPAHLERILTKGFKQSKATILGSAMHSWLTQRDLFNNDYTESTELYQRATGEHKAGDPKLDDEGDPIVMLKHSTDSSLDIKGEEYKKFKAMCEAYEKSDDAKALIESAKYIEASFFYKDMRVRPDFITADGWIVDIKTVGGTSDKPSSPERFGRDFFDNGYDIQMYMYYHIVKQEMPDIKGFKFLCLDAKQPSGIQIYTFIEGESKWFELGGYRFHEALRRLEQYKKESVHKVYEVETVNDLPLSYNAEDYLVRARAE